MEQYLAKESHQLLIHDEWQNMDEYKKLYTKWKKPTTEYYLYKPTVKSLQRTTSIQTTFSDHHAVNLEISF